VLGVQPTGSCRSAPRNRKTARLIRPLSHGDFSLHRVTSRRVALATMFHCVWQSASVCKRQGVATFCRTANTAYRHWSLRPTTIFRIAYYVRSFIHVPVSLTRATTWFLSLAFLSLSRSLSLFLPFSFSLFGASPVILLARVTSVIESTVLLPMSRV